MKRYIIFIAAFLGSLNVAQAQTPDNSFGINGRVRTEHSGSALAITRQPDGKLLTAGFAYDNFGYNQLQILRFKNDGSLDSSFGTNGSVITEISFTSKAKAILLQPDGKIIVGGTYQTGDFANIYHLFVARYNADGSTDNTFGTNGIIMPEPGFTDELKDMALQPDGRIVVAGAISDDMTMGITSFLIARFNENGTADASFGTGGMVTTVIEATSEVEKIALLADGSIIAAGQSGLYDSPDPDYRNFAIAKYNSHGNPDPSFGVNGIVKTDVIAGAADFLHSMVMQPDGKILTAGSLGNNHYLLRYQSNGNLDSTFGTNGKAIRTSTPSNLYLTLRTDGKILTTCMSVQQQMGSDFMVNGYLANGSVNTNFGLNGTLRTDFPSAIPEGSTDLSYCALMQPDGKLVVAGVAEGFVALVRYGATGETSVNDPAFNNLELTVYPNPFNDVINLRLAKQSGTLPVTVTLDNILGQQIFSIKAVLKGADTTIQLPNLIAGNYILSVTTDKGDRMTRKITKNTGN